MINWQNKTEDEINEAVERYERETIRLKKQIDEYVSSFDACEEKLDQYRKRADRLEKEIKDFICFLEVEHFLEYGPEGNDSNQ